MVDARRRTIRKKVALEWTRTTAEVTAYLPFKGFLHVTICQQAPPSPRSRDDIVCLDEKDVQILVETMDKVRAEAEKDFGDAVFDDLLPRRGASS